MTQDGRYLPFHNRRRAGDGTPRLLLAGLYGGAIGYERRQADKPAGLRTLSLVAIGAALFTLISAFGFDVGDPARVAAQIVTGIGFLGARGRPSGAAPPSTG